MCFIVCLHHSTVSDSSVYKMGVIVNLRVKKHECDCSFSQLFRIYMSSHSYPSCCLMVKLPSLTICSQDSTCISQSYSRDPLPFISPACFPKILSYHWQSHSSQDSLHIAHRLPENPFIWLTDSSKESLHVTHWLPKNPFTWLRDSFKESLHISYTLFPRIPSHNHQESLNISHFSQDYLTFFPRLRIP